MIDRYLDELDWKRVADDPNPGEVVEVPYVTHVADMEVMGHSVKVEQLSTGMRVVNEMSLAMLLEKLSKG